MKDRTDEDLVAELARREDSGADARRLALGELIVRYEHELYSYLVRFTCDEAMAEDLFQECFLKLARSAWRFDASRPLRPWLYTMAANLARDELRKKRWEVERPLDGAFRPGREPLDAAAARGRSPVDEAASREEAAALRIAVAELDGHLREVVELHFFGGLTCRETARRMCIPIGTVKSRLHAALVRLGAVLESSGIRRAVAS